MKYNNLYSVFAAILLLLGSSACSLNEDPKDQMDEETAFGSTDLVYVNTVAKLYNEIGGDGGGKGLGGTDRGLYDLNTFTSDEAMLPTRGGDWVDGGLWQNLFTHNWGTQNAVVRDTWNYLYKVIGMANQSIDKLNEIIELKAADDPIVAELESYRSEVKALRAMYYYYLLDLYARVPIVTSSTQLIADTKQSSRSEVFEFVRTELEASIPQLNPAHSNLQGLYYGRITQPVAYFVLAKLALNAEVYTDNDWVNDDVRPDGKTIQFTPDGIEMNAWETVVYCVDKIKELGYTLATNYASNFSVVNETSVENIFTIPMDPKLYKFRMINLIRSRHYAHADAYGLAAWNGAAATKTAIKIFGYNTSGQDPRFDLNYFSGLVEGPKGIIQDNGEDLYYYPEEVVLVLLDNNPYMRTAGARMKKYEIDINAGDAGQLQNNDYVLFRYADALLMKSEALVRNGQNGDDPLAEVRSRVGATPRPATLENLLDERLLELAWEGHRRQDLVRFGLFNRKIDDRNATDKHLTVFPIDNDILSLNINNLSQNEGY